MEVEGNENYKAMCASLAAEHGFEVMNPELQERIKQIREGLSAQDRAEKERRPQGQHIRVPERRPSRPRDEVKREAGRRQRLCRSRGALWMRSGGITKN